MAPRNRPADLEGSIQKLSVKDGTSRPSGDQRGNVADSWEDAALSEEDGRTTPTRVDRRAKGTEQSRPPTSDYPGPPPPTPASPGFSSHSRSLSKNGPAIRSTTQGFATINFDDEEGSSRSTSRPSTSSQARPEKTTATASRMIAAGLGVKAPRRTEDERQYDRAARDNERKKRDEVRDAERAERERVERCKKDMWGED